MANGSSGYPRGSIFGAFVLLSLGGLFLYANLNPEFGVWRLIGQYWPLLIVFWGISKLINYLALRGTPEAASAGRLRAGEIFGLILLLLFGTAFSQIARLLPDEGLSIGIDGGEPIWGNRYEFPVELTETVELPGTLTIARGRNITVSAVEGDELRMVARKVVHAWDEEEAREIADRYEPVLEKVAGGYELRWRRGSGSSRAPRYDIELFVPAALNLSLDARDGDVTVKNLKGNLEVDIRGGDLTVDDLVGDLAAKLRSSSIRAEHVRGNANIEGSGGEVLLRTISGSATLKGEYYGPIQLAAIQGPASFKSRRTDFTALRIDGEMSIDSGDMVVRGVPGEVTLETRDKEIELDDILGPVRIENRNGPVVIRFRKAPTQPIEVTNSRGRIEIVLPENSGFEIEATNRRGDIESDFTGEDLNLNEEDRRTKILTGTYGSRQTTIVLRTSVGVIRIRRAE